MLVAGLLAPLEQILSVVLEWLHATLGLSWAWSIVALTVIVRMLLVPLTIRQIRSMQNLQRHAPELKAIQQRYKHDRRRMNEELMRFYKENGIKPATSFLPMLAQIPVFFALYFVLRNFERVTLPRLHEPVAHLGWLGIVPDITSPARSHWTGYLLVAIYAASQTTSTLLMRAGTSRMQRALMLALPLGFIAVVVTFPAGLVLYWATTNLWTTGQGIVTRRLLAPVGLGKRPSAVGSEPPGEPRDLRAAAPRRVKRKKKPVRR